MGQRQSVSEEGSDSPTTTTTRGKRSMQTIHSNHNFDAEAACEELNKSMKGWGTDEDTLMSVLTKHSNDQRQEIKEKYMAMFGEDLVDQIKGEVDGHFQELIVGLLTPRIAYDAACVRDALKGSGTDEDTLIAVLVGKSNSEIEQLKDEYQKLTERPLDDDIDSDLNGPFQCIIRALLSANRELGGGDEEEAEQDAKDLLDAGINQWGTDESKFNSILCAKSFRHLHRVFRHYTNLAGHDIEEDIESEFGGDTQKALLAIIRTTRDTPAFFARRLHNVMSGLGTTDHALIRILVTRSEIDLGDIKERYYEMYEEALADKVKGEAGGDYEKGLLLVMGVEPAEE